MNNAPAPHEDHSYDNSTEVIGRFSRRNMLRWLIGISSGAFAIAFGVPAIALKALQGAIEEITAGDALVYAAPSGGAVAGDPLRAGDIGLGQSVQAFPSGKTDNQRNLIQVVRIAPGQGKEGLVAYSAICTHLGCAVFARLNDAGQIACPCHASQFDPANNAAVRGGPAPRPLPGLPIDVQPDGTIVATGPVDGPIGVA